MARQIIGIGEIVMDATFLREGILKLSPGGSAFNAATSLARLACHPIFIGELGNDHLATVINKFMRQNEFNTSFITSLPNCNTQLALAHIDENGNARYDFYKDKTGNRLPISIPKPMKDDILFFGSYFAINPSVFSSLIKYLQKAHLYSSSLYYDVNFRPSHLKEKDTLFPNIIQLMKIADIVRLSHEDFHHVFGNPELESFLQIYNQYCLPNETILIITQGADPVWLFTPQGHQEFPVIPTEVVSTLGAGDSFNAGIVYALQKYNVSHDSIQHLPITMWQEIIDMGLILSAETCKHHEGYIPNYFSIR